MMRKRIPEAHLAVSGFLLLMIIFSRGLGQSNQTCFDCHDDAEFTMEKSGKEISLYVDPHAYEASPHEAVLCIDCHVGFDPEEEPHKKNITPVDCSSCHEDVTKSLNRSAHASELNCSTCHGDVHRPVSTAGRPVICESCHEAAVAAMKVSVHKTSPKGPACIDCHSPHAVEFGISDNCLACHGEKEFVHKNIAHEDVEFILKYRESIHGQVTECYDCHNNHEIFAVDSELSAVNRRNIVNTCAACHNDIAADYRRSEHGKSFQSGFELAPTCTNCHGEHDIHQITDSRSKVSRMHEAEVCLQCHLDSPEVQAKMTHDAGFIAGYENSIHGRAVQQGNLNAAVCSDCHGGHEEMKASNRASKVNKFNIAETCGKCHGEISRVFTESIHGQALTRGIVEAPSCTDCHGEHDIIEPEKASSPVAPQNVSSQVCGPCHNSVKLTEKYGISSDRFSAYNDSYHGLAMRFGDVEVANCASCHGVHNILPSSNPASTIYPANLARTCGECHPGANVNFTIGKVHVTGTAESDRLIYWISAIYVALIVGTVGAMGLHNLLDWIRKLKNKYYERYTPNYGLVEEEKKKIHYVRMTLEDRLQHWFLIISFFALVITGFMLKFPDAWWVIWIRQAGGESIFVLRGFLHRIAAVIMVLVTLYHIYYIAFTRRGRTFIKDMMFRSQDLRDMVTVLKYNLGLSRRKARFDRFNYIEKSEYWALVWGTVVMTLTGFALWFENQSMAWFSKLFLDACGTIHYFEAWLAFLAILVWHLYYVIFNPDVYPMNFTWITGKVTEEEMEHEHPEELARIKRSEEEEQAELETLEDLEK